MSSALCCGCFSSGQQQRRFGVRLLEQLRHFLCVGEQREIIDQRDGKRTAVAAAALGGRSRGDCAACSSCFRVLLTETKEASMGFAPALRCQVAAETGVVVWPMEDGCKVLQTRAEQ